MISGFIFYFLHCMFRKKIATFLRQMCVLLKPVFTTQYWLLVVTSSKSQFQTLCTKRYQRSMSRWQSESGEDYQDYDPEDEDYQGGRDYSSESDWLSTQSGLSKGLSLVLDSHSDVLSPGTVAEDFLVFFSFSFFVEN